MTTECILLVVGGVLLLSVFALQLMPSESRRYFADSMVVDKPLTNILLARSFQADVVRTIPGVLRLEAMPTSRWTAGSVPPARPNAIGIRIIAVGATPQNARRAIIDAATQLSGTVLTNYEVHWRDC